jgi:hypothetical protein
VGLQSHHARRRYNSDRRDGRGARGACPTRGSETGLEGQWVVATGELRVCQNGIHAFDGAAAPPPCTSTYAGGSRAGARSARGRWPGATCPVRARAEGRAHGLVGRGGSRGLLHRNGGWRIGERTPFRGADDAAFWPSGRVQSEWLVRACCSRDEPRLLALGRKLAKRREQLRTVSPTCSPSTARSRSCRRRAIAGETPPDHLRRRVQRPAGQARTARPGAPIAADPHRGPP